MDIGYFRFKDDRKKTMEINAMIHSFYGLTLVFFNEDDINYEDKTVVGRYYTVDGWKSKEVALPKIINNMRIKKPKEKSKVYTFLDKNSYLLFHNFGSKRYVENLLLENKLLEDLIIPSKIVTSKKDVIELFENNNKLLFKPIDGMKGRGIFTVEKNKEDYLYTDQSSSYTINEKELENKICKISNNYIGQKYISSKTKNNLPFDIRVQYEKNGMGKWVKAQTYARVGLSNPLVSNVDKGGAVIRGKSFLKNNFGEEEGLKLHKKLNKSLKGFPSKFEKLYDFNVSTIAVDLGLHNGEFYLFEVNSFPGGTFARGEVAHLRAAHTKYLVDKFKL